MLSYSQVKFNEVQPSNSKTQMDPDFYKYKDWIELYNTSSSSVDITLPITKTSLVNGKFPMDSRLALVNTSLSIAMERM